jgi:hypothetical protein
MNKNKQLFDIMILSKIFVPGWLAEGILRIAFLQPSIFYTYSLAGITIKNKT